MMEEQADYGGDKLKTKLCPFTNDTNGVYDCSGEDCAWWVNGDCAVVEIAKCLRGPVAVKNTPVVAGL